MKEANVILVGNEALTGPVNEQDVGVPCDDEVCHIPLPAPEIVAERISEALQLSPCNANQMGPKVTEMRREKMSKSLSWASPNLDMLILHIKVDDIFPDAKGVRTWNLVCTNDFTCTAPVFIAFLAPDCGTLMKIHLCIGK